MARLTLEQTWIPVVIPRDEFARSYFWYKPGEHLIMAGPTQRGKTTLAFKLLEYTATPECPVYVAVSKPRDPVTEREMRRLDYRLVHDWPVPPRIQDAWNGKPSGYVIWPKFGDIDKDVRHCSEVTRRLLLDRYTQGVKGKKGILMCDDTVVKSKIYKLDREMVTITAMAGAMGIGQWEFVQKPTGSGEAALWGYGNSEHIFLFRDPDRRNRERYDEIGGVDPHQVQEITLTLSPYQALYLKRTPGKNGEQIMCVVDSK
jgi:hypothetical protein